MIVIKRGKEPNSLLKFRKENPDADYESDMPTDVLKDIREQMWEEQRCLCAYCMKKIDAPSGTAIALADSINEAMADQYVYNYDRSHERKKREKNEIGIVAVRGGTIVGQHDVIFAGADEVIEFHHTAYSKAIFGKGAVEAAKFLAGKPAGMYDMSDVIGL